jgi:50S ribosomal protein L16 3-hydroxylase
MNDALMLFDQIIPERLSRCGHVPSTARVTCVFELTGSGGGTWTVDLKAQRCTPGKSASADCLVTCDADLFMAAFKDTETAQRLYYEGKLTIAGDVGAVIELVGFLSQDTSDVGLEGLLRPFSVAEFLRDKWPNEAVVIHGPRERLGAFAQLPELADIPALFRSWPGLVMVYPPKSADEFDAPMVPADQAQRLFELGHSCAFSYVNSVFPTLEPWVRAVGEGLGIPLSANSRNHVYVTPRGSGASTHFDANSNFVVQLSGTKVWQLAPNTSIVNPNDRYALSASEVPRKLREHAIAPYPKEMPEEGRQTVTLRAGSVLFVPRGWWHATLAEEDALSLNFTYAMKDWTSVVVDAIKARLESHPEWRAFAKGAGSSDPALSRSAALELEKLLPRLPDLVAGLDVDTCFRSIVPAKRGETLDLRPRDWVKLLANAK